MRRALAERSATDAWTVSLVKLQGRWSVTLDAPAARLRAVTLAAPEGRLGESIRDALRGAAPAAAPAHAAPASPAMVSGGPAVRPTPAAAPAPSPPSAPAALPGRRQQCEKCRRGFAVHYDSRPGEPLETAPVACPHCWHVNRVQIGAEAAFSKDYRAEKV